MVEKVDHPSRLESKEEVPSPIHFRPDDEDEKKAFKHWFELRLDGK